jgi:hypothetical protein
MAKPFERTILNGCEVHVQHLDCNKLRDRAASEKERRAMVAKFDQRDEDTKERYLTGPELEISSNKVGELHHEIHVVHKWEEWRIGLLPVVFIVIDLNTRLVGEIAVIGPGLRRHGHLVLPIGMERPRHGLELLGLVGDGIGL